MNRPLVLKNQRWRRKSRSKAERFGSGFDHSLVFAWEAPGEVCREMPWHPKRAFGNLLRRKVTLVSTKSKPNMRGASAH